MNGESISIEEQPMKEVESLNVSTIIKKRKKSSKIVKNRNKVKKIVQGKLPKYRVPKNKLDDALNLINNSSLWIDTPKHLKQCSKIHKSFECSRNTMINLLIEARKCLLRRDWVNLAKILTIAKPNTSYDTSHFFPPFVQYAAVCLAHNPDLNLMDVFLEGVASNFGKLEKQEFVKFTNIIS